MPRRFVHRHHPPACLPCWLKAGVGAGAAFFVMYLLGDATGASMLVAPMGASAVLIFGIPESPMAQPAHVIGGHLVAALVALAADHLLPGGPLTLAATVGGVIALVGILRLTHPPAGATAMVVMMIHPGWEFALMPVTAGAVTLVVAAVLVHKLPPRTHTYPLPVGEGASG
ncbi:MAG: HPP family protein [Actinomycetota bacterium]